MDFIYLINLTLIGACVIFCVYRGFKCKMFKSLSFAYTCVLAGCLGSRYGKLLFPNIDVLNIENKLLEKNLTEKINSTVVSLLGTLILIISLDILLKQIFKVVDGRWERSLYVEILDRLRGAVDGLFVLYKIGNISIDSNIEISRKITVECLLDKFVLRKNTDIHKLVRNLN